MLLLLLLILLTTPFTLLSPGNFFGFHVDRWSLQLFFYIYYIGLSLVVEVPVRVFLVADPAGCRTYVRFRERKRERQRGIGTGSRVRSLTCVECRFVKVNSTSGKEAK